MDYLHVLYVFDLIGTAAFAMSGALLGIKKEMDIYGMAVLAFVTGVGGGTFRDIILDKVPPFVFTDFNYIIVIFAATFIVYFMNSIVSKSKPLMILNVVDAIGLGVFTCIGASTAMDLHIGWYGVVFFGLVTATLGGMIRDVLAGEVPFVLKKEVYASASIIGGLLFLLLDYVNISREFNILITSAVVTFIRLFTMYKNIHLPALKTNQS